MFTREDIKDMVKGFCPASIRKNEKIRYCESCSIYMECKENCGTLSKFGKKLAEDELDYILGLW